MVTLFVNGWLKSPSWFKCVFVIVCIWAVFWIVDKIIINAIAVHYARKLVRDELKILMDWRDKIRDYLVVEKHWECYEKDGVRYYECGLIKMIEMEVFKNILHQHGAEGLPGVVFMMNAIKEKTTTDTKEE